MIRLILISLFLFGCGDNQQPAIQDAIQNTPQQPVITEQQPIQPPIQQPVIINQQPQQSSITDALLPGMVGYMMGRNNGGNNTQQIIHRERVIYRDAPAIAPKQPTIFTKPPVTLPNKSMVTRSGFSSFSRRATSDSRKR